MGSIDIPILQRKNLSPEDLDVGPRPYTNEAMEVEYESNPIPGHTTWNCQVHNDIVA